MLELLRQPWPWYIAGPLIGLMIPLLLIMGNRHFGISANLRHICAMLPNHSEFFHYDWKKESWNLVFLVGIIVGGALSVSLLASPEPLTVAASTAQDLQSLNVTVDGGYMPTAIYSWAGLFTLKGFILMVVGGFLVGFGARYAGGCTSGHAIMGLSELQLPSLVAVLGFFAGGLLMTHFILPLILKL